MLLGYTWKPESRAEHSWTWFEFSDCGSLSGSKHTHDLSDDNNWWKDAVAVLFLPPHAKPVSAQPSSDFTESKNRLFPRVRECSEQWIIAFLPAGSKPCISNVRIWGWKFHNGLLWVDWFLVYLQTAWLKKVFGAGAQIPALWALLSFLLQE